MTNYTNFHQRIFIYEVLTEFNAPLVVEGDHHVELKVGDRMITIGTDAFVPDDQAPDGKHGSPEDNMSKAIFNSGFVEANPKLFKKL